MKRKLLWWSLAALAALVLAWFVLSREGGCDRTPPDDDEPVPADCKPGQKECYGAEPTTGAQG